MATIPRGIDDVLKVVGDLAQIVSDRFDKMEARVDSIDARLYRVEQKQLEHDEMFAKINQRIDHLYPALDSHMKRIEDIVADNVA